MKLLQLSNVTKNYNQKKKKAVENIDIVVNASDCVGFIGSNGAGKSTLIGMIATLIKPSSGKILYKGNDISKNKEIIRMELGYVPQDIALYENLSGMDNLILWSKLYNLEKSIIKERIYEVCDMVSFPYDKLMEKVENYSGGMKRKLNIGAALLHKPQLVIMDEPTVGIDIVSRNHIMETLIKLKKQGTSILYVGHYLEEIESICNKVCILEEGKVVIYDEISKLLYDGVDKINLKDYYIAMKV